MTLVENQELRKKMEQMGYYINTFSNDKRKWCAHLKQNDQYHERIIDCSYDGMRALKYRVSYDGIFIYLPMEVADVNEIMKYIVEPEKELKHLKMMQRLNKVSEDF